MAAMTLPAGPRIRLAEQSDLPAVCEIVNVHIATSVANFRTAAQAPGEWETLWRELRTSYPWYVAEANGEIAGVAYARPWNPRGAYDWTAESTVYVARERHGRGLGSALYARLLTTLAQQGYRCVIAGIALPNDASVALHTSLGFEHVGTIRAAGYKHGGWHDVGYWQRRFSPDREPPGEIRPVPSSD
jgi:phosphinothricin acetyltransferase